MQKKKAGCDEYMMPRLVVDNVKKKRLVCPICCGFGYIKSKLSGSICSRCLLRDSNVVVMVEKEVE